MTKERELLERAMSLIDYRYAPSEAVAVHREIQELLAQPEQEPVEDRIARWHKLGYEQGRKSLKREPLSDEQIEAAREGNTITVHEFARAIEKAHGIGGGE